MNRVERFREIRRYRRKVISILFLALLIFISGIYIVDYSTNFLMTSEKGIKIVSFNTSSDYFEVNFMNKTIHLNTKYFQNGLKNIGKYINGIIGLTEDIPLSLFLIRQFSSTSKSTVHKSILML